MRVLRGCLLDPGITTRELLLQNKYLQIKVPIKMAHAIPFAIILQLSSIPKIAALKTVFFT